MIERRVDISQSGKVWMLLAIVTVFLYVIWQLTGSILAGNFRAMLLVAAGFAAFFILSRISTDWRSGVYLFIIWLLFEDLVRKYMGNNMYVFFAKDVLVGVTYLSLIAERTRRDVPIFRPPFKYSLGMFFLLMVVQVFNPRSPSAFYGLLGLKLYFYYVPLMFVGYAMLRKVDDLRHFLVVNMVIAAVIASVGIIQSIIGLDFLNPHGGADLEMLSHLQRTTPSGVVFSRPPSVFVSDGRFGAYLLLVFILGMGAAGLLLLRGGRGRFIVFPSLGMVVVGTVIIGSRGGVMFVAATAIVLTAGMLWGAPEGRAGGYRLVKAIRRGFIFVAVATSLAVTIFPNVIGARWTYYRETLSPNSEHYEGTLRTWDYPIGQLTEAFTDPDWFMGHGSGTTSLGTQYVSRILEVPSSDIWVENGFGELIVELGILGPILWLLWTSSLLISSLKTTLRLKGTWAFPVALSIIWFAFLMLIGFTWSGMNNYENFISNAYLWLFVGILFRLPELVSLDAKGPIDSAFVVRAHQ